MRPALAALAEQQKTIDEMFRQINHLTSLAAAKDLQIKQLTRGLAAVAKLTGYDHQVRTAIFKRADEQNPAQPVPDPNPEGPVETTAEAETPEAYADVRAPGLVPGSNNDTGADAVTTTYTPGGDVPSPAINQLVDVTRPIDGTQGPRPLAETKTQTDVRVGDPMNAQVAYPVNGPFANAQRTSAKTESDGSKRVMAAMRLAKLRVAMGMSESGDDTIEFENIVKDSSLSDDAVQLEVNTLSKIQTTAAKTVDAPRNVVPRSASPIPTVPKMTRSSALSSTSEDDELMGVFLGDISE